MPSFGNLFASLTLESASFMSGIKASQKAIAETQRSFASAGAKMQQIGAVMTVGITAPFTAMVASSIDGAKAQRAAMAQVNSALASMGPVAGKTADELSRAADAMEMRSLFDADVILTKVTANLLTFGNVSGQVFDRAQQAAIDMAQRLGQDPQAAAIMLGKALNDPIKGITALTRVGVSFSAAQQEQIKAMAAAGNTAGAQAMILTELERQYGGAAAAAANTDPYRQMNVALGQSADVLGELALQVLPPITNAIAGLAQAFLALPAPVQTGTVAVVAIAAALGPVIAAVGTLTTAIGAILPVFAALRVAALTTAIPAIISFAAVLAPILIPLAAVAAAIAAVVYAVRNWDQIKAFVQRAIGYIQALYQQSSPWLRKLIDTILAVLNPIDTLKRGFFKLYDAVVGHSYIPDMVTEIGQHMRRLDDEMVKPTTAAISKTEEAFRAMAQAVKPILDRLFPEQARANRLAQEIALIRQNADALGLSAENAAEAIDRLRGEYRADVTGAPQQTAADVVGNAPDLIDSSRVYDQVADSWAKTQAANDNLKASFADMARDVSSSLQGLVNNIKSGDWLGAVTSVLDLIGQVSGIINGTNSPAPRTYSLNGARAKGGPVLPRGDYLVGERGPEILRMGGRRGNIIPNDQIGAGTVVQLVVGEGMAFEPRVTGISGSVSVETVRQNNQAQAFRQTRRIG